MPTRFGTITTLGFTVAVGTTTGATVAAGVAVGTGVLVVAAVGVATRVGVACDGATVDSGTAAPAEGWVPSMNQSVTVGWPGAGFRPVVLSTVTRTRPDGRANSAAG